MDLTKRGKTIFIKKIAHHDKYPGFLAMRLKNVFIVLIIVLGGVSLFLRDAQQNRLVSAAGAIVLTNYNDFTHPGSIFNDTFVRENGGMDGASIALLPEIADNFLAPPLANSIWTSGFWSGTGTFNPLIGSGLTIPADTLAFVHTLNKFGQPTVTDGVTIEYTARFNSTPDLSREAPQNIGLGLPNLDSQFIVFSTFDPTRPNQNSGHLYARIKNYVNDTILDLGTAYIGAYHRFRIDWFSAAPLTPGDARDRAVFYVDGLQVADLIANNTLYNTNLPPLYGYISNKSIPDDLNVSSIQISATYRPSGSYTSSILDATKDMVFTTLTWAENKPINTAVLVETSSSPDQVYWSPFSQVSNGGHIPDNGRYLKVRLTLSTSDPTVTPQIDSISISIGTPQADLNLLKSASAEAVSLGSQYTYTFVVQNTGPDSAAGLTVTDTLPAGISYVGFDPSTGWICTKPSGSVLCTYGDHGGSLGSGGSSQVTITVAAPNIIGTGNNQAVLSATTADPNLANNTSNIVTTNFTQPADLALVMTPSGNAVGVGQPFSYRIHVTNIGPNQAQSIKLVDTIPAQLVINAVNGTPDWSCGISSQVITCTLSGLEVGASPSDIQIDVTAPSNATILENTALVNSQTGDPDLANNTAHAFTQVVHLNYLPVVSR